jgi:lipoprotein-anchoring transpeptidase ErfK/SrfK
MSKKRLLITLILLLVFSLTSCTKDNTTPVSSVNVKVLETNDPNNNKQTPSETTAAPVPPKEEVKPQSAIEPPKEEQKTEPAVIEPPKEPTVFKQGDNGDKIKEIQEKLNKFGYKLAVDGSFGSSTYTAVVDFQNRNKILSDGIVGASTLEKLDKKPTTETMYKPPSPAPRTNDTAAIEQYINDKNFPSKTNYFIWIDIPNQRVNVFTGSNNNWQLLKSMICSTGKSYTPTVKGNFTVGSKGSYFIADGGARCKYYTQIKGNYLFHSVLYDNKGERIIDGTLGIPVSHGCVRLAVENAKFIYDTIPAGTAIWSN